MITFLFAVTAATFLFLFVVKSLHSKEVEKELREARLEINKILYAPKEAPKVIEKEVIKEVKVMDTENPMIDDILLQKRKELSEIIKQISEKESCLEQLKCEIKDITKQSRHESFYKAKSSYPIFTKRFTVLLGKEESVNLSNTYRYTTDGRRTVYQMSRHGNWLAVEYGDFFLGGLQFFEHKDSELMTFLQDGCVVLCILVWYQYSQGRYSCDFHAEVYNAPYITDKLVASLSYQMSSRSLCPTDNTFNYVLEIKKSLEEELNEVKKLKGDLYKESKSYLTRLSNRIGDLMQESRPVTEDRFIELGQELKAKKKECALLIKNEYYAALASSKGSDDWYKERISNLAITLVESLVDRLIENVFTNGLDKTKNSLVKIISTVEQLVPYELKFSVPNEYIDSKKQQLTMAYEIEIYKRKIKEERTRKLQAEREERAVQKEIEREIKRARKDELDAQAKLERRRMELTQAKSDTEILRLKEYISQLEDAVLEAKQRGERALSMAQQTRNGYVYIISNIGSFGEGVYKIGMTRRIEPMERVVELGDASVPFPFDVHAMIWSEDAPTLEAELHRTFDDRKVNAINGRKEFFRVTLDEVRTVLDRMGVDAAIVDYPTAAQYRDSLMIAR